MLGRTNTGGGGGGSLNFQVVGNPQPTNPKANTIWLNTDVPIAGYEFTPTEPANPVQGMAWVAIGTSSPVAFNALKKNSVMVYPISTKQYIDGAWVDKTAKSYQGGAWKDWRFYLYSRGDECEAVTGGWIAVQAQTHMGMGVATRGPNYLLADSNWVDNVGGTSVGWTFPNDIDLTDFKTLKFVITTTQALNCRVSVYKGTNYVDQSIASLENPSATETELSIDISKLIGAYKVNFGAWGGTDMTLFSAWLE